MYEDYLELSDNKVIYIFNLFKNYKSDYDRFIKGNYSQLSLGAKVLILDFFGEADKAGEYIHTFLSPEESFKAYADYFDIEEEVLFKIGELCSIPDMVKETLIDNKHSLYQLLKKESIHLTK